MTKTRALLSALTLVGLAALTVALAPPARSEILVGGASRVVVPVMANTAGANNSLFRTKVVILNVTNKAYTIQAILYGGNGQVSLVDIPMAAGQIRNYENFLADVFSNYGPAGAVAFNSNALGNDFIVASEVFNDIGEGRYKTVTNTGALLEPSLPEFDSFSLGITVVEGSAGTRTNIGFFNDASEPSTITGDLFNASGTKITTISTTLPAKSWAQQGLPNAVVNGYIKWKVTAQTYCYAVVVDNRSSDGTFILAADYLP